MEYSGGRNLAHHGPRDEIDPNIIEFSSNSDWTTGHCNLCVPVDYRSTSQMNESAED